MSLEKIWKRQKYKEDKNHLCDIVIYNEYVFGLLPFLVQNL